MKKQTREAYEQSTGEEEQKKEDKSPVNIPISNQLEETNISK